MTSQNGLVSKALGGYLQKGLVQREAVHRGGQGDTDLRTWVVLQEGTILQGVNHRKKAGHQGDAEDRREVVRQVLFLLLLLVVVVVVVSSASEGTPGPCVTVMCVA